MNKYEQAEFFGLKNRLVKLCEECGELIQACTKYYEAIDICSSLVEEDEKFVKDKIEEELADVYLLGAEVRYLLNIHGSDLEQRIDYKVDRTNGMIDMLKEDRLKNGKN